jgi:putative transposase
MPKRLKRYYGAGHLHFVTCSCYQRKPLLGRARTRNLFVRLLGEVRDRYRFSLVGYVVMPDHIHLLMSEPEVGTPSVVMQVLKQRVSRRLRKRPVGPTLQTTKGGPPAAKGGPPTAKGGAPDGRQLRLWGEGETPTLQKTKGGAPELPRFWQRRFYDFKVWSHKKRREKLDYMHFNPVKRGLVRRPQDWPWSRCQFYAGEDPTLGEAKGGAPPLLRIDPV